MPLVSPCFPAQQSLLSPEADLHLHSSHYCLHHPLSADYLTYSVTENPAVSTATCLLKCCVQWDRPVFHPVFGLPSPPPLSDPSLDYSLLSRISDRLLSKSCFPSAFLTSLYLGRVERVRETASMTTVLFLFHISSLYLFMFLFLPVLCSMWNLSPHPCPGIEPMPPELEAQSLSHWPPGKSLFLFTRRFIERIICAVSTSSSVHSSKQQPRFPHQFARNVLTLEYNVVLVVKANGCFPVLTLFNFLKAPITIEFPLLEIFSTSTNLTLLVFLSIFSQAPLWTSLVLPELSILLCLVISLLGLVLFYLACISSLIQYSQYQVLNNNMYSTNIFSKLYLPSLC